MFKCFAIQFKVIQLLVCGTVYAHTAVAIRDFFGYHHFYKLNKSVIFTYEDMNIFELSQHMAT